MLRRGTRYTLGAATAVALMVALPLRGQAGVGIIVTITNTQAGGGHDTVTWTAAPASSWYVELRCWDPGYHPSGQGDTGGSPANQTIAEANGSVEDHQEDVNVKSKIAAQYQNPQGSAYYLFHIRGYRVGGGYDDAYSGIRFYSLP